MIPGDEQEAREVQQREEELMIWTTCLLGPRLSGWPGMEARAIAFLLEVPRSRVNRLLRRMEERGEVRRCSWRNRRAIIWLAVR